MTTRSALFRFDAGADMGGGHAVRCLTLAAALEADGWNCRFAVSPESIETVPSLAARPDDCGSFEELANAGPYDAVIVDHYGWQADQETPCRDIADHVLVIDDLADRPHDADILLDQNLGRGPADYDGLVADSCRRLTGPVYSLLKPAFAARRDEALARRDRGGLSRVIVAFGLTDASNLSERALGALDGMELEVEVVLGAAAPHLAAVRDRAAALSPPARVIVDTDDMATHMAAADLALGACGTTSWERCALGLPTLAVLAADNQRAIGAALEAAGAVTLLGWHEDVSEEDFKRHLNNPGALLDQAPAAAAICDGRGTTRVVGALNDLADGLTPSLRMAAMDDADRLLAWRNDEETRRQSKTTEPVARDSHLNWLQGVLDDPSRTLCIAELNGQAVGSVRADRDGESWVLSWVVAPEARGRGQGRRIVERMVERLSGTIHAEVKTSNPASERIAAAVGMHKVSETESLTLWTMNK